MNKGKIIFTLALMTGNAIIGSIAFFYLGKDTLLESIAVFTSISTAVYTILKEPEKPKPLLRIQPIIISGSGMGSLGLDVLVDNIGEAPAKNIQVSCKLIPQTDIVLEKNGVGIIPFLARNERATCNVIVSIQQDKLSSQNFVIEATYSDSEDKKQKPIRVESSIEVLRKNFETWILTKNR